MNTPTQLQRNAMIFTATFCKSSTVAEATDLLDWLLTDITDMELLADQLRFHGFIANIDAVNLAKGKGWTVAEMPQEKFDRYITPNRFSRKADAR